MVSNMEVMDRGIRSLIEALGVVGAEQFISFIIREQFDYTKWQRERFDGMTIEEINEAAIEYAHDHQFKGKRIKKVYHADNVGS